MASVSGVKMAESARQELQAERQKTGEGIICMPAIHCIPSFAPSAVETATSELASPKSLQEML